MIFYDWLKVRKVAGDSAYQIINAMKSIVLKKNKEMPRYKDKVYEYYCSNLEGTSFMLNADTLLKEQKRWTAKEVAQYIQVASYRSFSDYKITGNLRLKTYLCPLPLDTISKNRLLIIDNDEIIFVYEEDSGEIFKMTGVSFGTAKSSAGREKLDQYEIKTGDNVIRVFGNILARYIYWPKNSKGRGMPVENLSFNRETQAFDNATKDYVKEYFPDIKSQWGYSILCIDNDEPKIFNFKKKLFQQIQANLDDLGDPTDPENGWLICFSKKKTGPLPINVEYTLQTVKCLKSKGPLSDKEKEIIAKSKPIEELLPRATPEQQKEFLEKMINGDSDEAIDDEAAAEAIVAE